MNKTFLIIVLLLLAYGNCSSTKKSKSNKIKYNFCKLIDTLVDERRVTKGSNYFANQIIPVLTEESGIESNYKMGYFGFSYSSDSLFDADVAKWRKYFNCR